jgi:hypothetical protein
MKQLKQIIFLMYFVVLQFTLQPALLHADDTDIFNDEKPPVPPNVLFVLDGSGSMDTNVSGTNKTRMQVMQGALIDLITSKDPATGEYNTKDINIGLMSFSNRVKNNNDFSYSWLVHGPAFPVTPIDDPAQSVMASNPLFTVADFLNSYLPAAGANDSARDYAPQIINQWDTGAGTPIVGALFEAAKYMRGEDVYWGNKPPNKIQSAHPSTYEGLFLANGSTNNTTLKTTIEPCGGIGQPVCNKQKSCTTSVTVSPPVESDTPIAGQDCTAIPYTKTCAAGETFCGDAQDATSCTVTSAQTTFSFEECTAGSEAACVALGVGYTGCFDPDRFLCDVGDTIAACQLKHPTWTDCQADAMVPGYTLVGRATCEVPPAEIPPGNPQTCAKKTVSGTASVSCPATKYSCTLSTSTETCTHVVTSTIISSGVNYKSPIKKECQSNAIILLSDGGPTVSNSAELVSSMIGSNYSQDASGLDCKDVPVPSNPNAWKSAENINYHGRCGIELARFLAQTDNNVTLNGDQPINLYTIGFALGANSFEQKYMEDLAIAGGGKFYPADNAADLMDAFKDAITNSNKARLFSPPTFTPNPTSLLSHGEIVYLPVFSRERGTTWSGNLKKFKIHDGYLTEADVTKKVMDSSGKMRKDAVDLWATGALEHPVKSGGAASKLDPSSRKILTDNGTSLVALNANNVTKAQLTPDNNPVIGDAERARLIDYIKGWDDQGKPRHHMGDIIHSKPVFVDYPSGRRVIFVGTNEGFLHAINDTDGSEAFAYMPSDLLSHIKIQKDNNPNDSHPYGVDGQITIWKGKINETDADESVLLLFGLRRGGKAYYALNVTDPDAPKLQWRKVHGTGRLGFSWSQPKTARVIHDGTPKNVVVFGGGYVDDHANEAIDSGTGADVFIVDMKDGSTVWSASKLANNPLKYAIPGGIRVMDLDGNGFADHFYFADTGGFVWRIDIKDTYKPDGVKLYQFADLAGSSHRKFFNEPDAAFFKKRGRYVVTLAIGSGERPDPLNETSDDAFFVLIDKHPAFYASSETPNKPEVFDDSKLVSLTSVSTGLDKSIFSQQYKDKKGWFYKLAKGEKILTDAITFENKIIFTSFSALDNAAASTTQPADPCKATTEKSSQLYIMKLFNGKAVLNTPSVSPGPAEITEPPVPYYPKAKPADCKKGHCPRASQVIVTRGGAPIILTAPRRLPKVYWIDDKSR